MAIASRPTGSRACRSGERSISSTRCSSRGTLYPAMLLAAVRVRARRASARGRRAAARPRRRAAPALVGDADDHRVEHVGVRLQRGLDLFGEDLLAAGVDAHRAAAEQRDRAVGLDRGEVAGHRRSACRRTLDERLRRLLRVLVVAERHVARAGDLADDAGAGLDARGRRRARRCRATAGARSGRPSSRCCPSATTVHAVVTPPSDEPTASVDDQVREALEELVLHRRREHRRVLATANSEDRS